MTKEEKRAYNAAYHRSHPRDRRAYNAMLYAANAAKIRAAVAAYRKANPEKTLAAIKAWRKANPGKMRAAMAAWAAANPEKSRARNAAWRKRHPETVKANNSNEAARRRGAEGRHTKEEVKQLLARQKFRCAVCKKSIEGGYHKDHIVPVSRGGSNYIRNLQLLCPKCNLKKGKKNPIRFMQEMGYLL